MAEREQAGQQSWEKEMFRLLVENVKDYAIFIVDPQGRVQSWNPGAERLLGYTEDEILGQSADIFFTPEDVRGEEPRREMHKALETGRGEDDRWHVRKDGSRFWASGTMTPLRQEDGSVRGFAKIVRDRTEWKEAESARRSSEVRQAAIVETALDCIIAIDHEGRIIDFNPAAERTFGHARMEALGSDIAELIIPPRLRPAHYQGLAHYLATGEGPVLGRRIEMPALRADGSEFPVELSITRIPTDGLPQFTAYLRDISERKRAEEALRASEASFRQLADSMPQIVWTAHADGVLEYYNRRWFEFTGLSESADGQQNWLPFLHPDDVAPCLDKWRQSMQSGTTFEMELRLRDHRTGGFRWHLARSVASRDESGQVIRWFGTSTDIDEQKWSNEVARFLADASASLASIVDYESTLGKVARLAVPFFADWCGVDVTGPDGTLRPLALAHVDPAKIELAKELRRRYPPRTEEARGASNVLRTGQPEMVAVITDELLTASARDDEHLRILRELNLQSYIAVPLVARGRPLGVLSFITSDSRRHYSPADLTLAQDLAHRAAIAIENALLYAELREADRLKDEFLAMLAHELRNPLAPIRNALHILKQPQASGAIVSQAREMAERQVQHMARLLDDLLDVSRISRGKIELRSEPVDVAVLVGRTVEAVRPFVAERRHQLTVALAGESLRVEGDPTRLEQVLTNLLNNAVKYTDPGGHLHVAAEGDGREVVLRVRDSGIGIDAEMLPKIFDLFVQAERRLDRSRGGVGIGLTLVRRLVELHGGTIEARSAGLGHGSEFIVRLSVLAGSAASDEAGKEGETSAAPLPRHRVLVVDDNQDAADSLAVLLRMADQDVRTAYDGTAALAVAAEFQPSLVFLDIGMPGMDGYEVARRLRRQPSSESASLVALTGWGQEEDRRRSREAGFDHHLVKPVEFEALQRLLAETKA